MTFGEARVEFKDHAVVKLGLALLFAYTEPFLVGFALQNLWNWFVAEAIHGQTISYWQALGFIMVIYILTDHSIGVDENWKRMFVIAGASVPDNKRSPQVINAIGEKEASPWFELIQPSLGKAVKAMLCLVGGWAIHTFLV